MKKRIQIFCFCCFLSILSIAQEPYQNKTLSAESRAEDLVHRLTLEEKISLMMDNSQAVQRLGIKPFSWWNEALHGVARAGVATVFPQPIGIAASFDPDMVYRVYSIVSDEARAKNTYFASQNSYKRYQGLTLWTPTINIFRDPRWGRGIETYGEDPYLTSVMGVAVVKGLQGPDSARYNKAHACAKHFAVHSGPEWNRHSFDARNIKARDLYETYLPAFKALVTKANVKEVMCAYNRFEGEPCCGSKQLLNNILRNEWKFKGVVVADCGAVADFYKANAHQTHPDVASASADAVIKGTDIDCGGSYKSLKEATEKGLISEKDIDKSILRLLRARFELGEMDKPEDVSWTKIPYSVVASAAHDSVALDAARKSMVLLYNNKNILPLKRDNISIAVMGPNAHDSIMQWGNYHGTPLNTITIKKGIVNEHGKNKKVYYEKACGLVERTLIASAFENCNYNEKRGFAARYWNNMEQQGEVVAEVQIATPFNMCTSGATVFAPGVNLTNFSARYNSVFTAQQTGNLYFEFFACGLFNLSINDSIVKTFRNNHGSRKFSFNSFVKAGESYKVQIDFQYTSGDAQFNFDMGFKKEIDIQQSIAAVKDADVVVFAGGISPSLEGEEMGVNLPGFKKGDRLDIELPDVQKEFLIELKKAGKKVIFINCSGSPINLEPVLQNCEALVQAWYPGQSGGKAVADVLFGNYNPSGRLPVTFYRNISQVPDFEDYNMTNRTYRFMKEQPLFPFGFGLSYTSFQYGKLHISKENIMVGEAITLTIPVTNTGKVFGEEVVQVYLKNTNDPSGPIKTLRAFKRVAIPAGETVNVTIELSSENLEWWNENTSTMQTHAGDYQLMVGGSSKNEDLTSIHLKIQ